MSKYMSKRLIDRKVRQVIVDENGKIINRKPSKEELKGLEEEFYNTRRGKLIQYTEKQLLDFLVQSYKDLGRPPTQLDFTGNSKYPSYVTYQKRFGSWSAALKLVGLDIDSMVIKGIIETSEQKRRFSEIIIRDHFKQHSVDLAGTNKTNYCDGICPNGKTYDVKSSGFRMYFNGEGCYQFHVQNKYKEEIEIYYLLAFNKDWTKLDYGWRIPGKIIESDSFIINTSCNSCGEFTIENMKECDITEKLREVLNKYGYFEKIRNYRKARDKGMTIYEYDKQLYDGCIVVE